MHLFAGRGCKWSILHHISACSSLASSHGGSHLIVSCFLDILSKQAAPLGQVCWQKNLVDEKCVLLTTDNCCLVCKSAFWNNRCHKFLIFAAHAYLHPCVSPAPGCVCNAGLNRTVEHRGTTLVCGHHASQDKCAASVTICNSLQRCQRGECKREDIYSAELSAAARGQKWWWSGLHLQSGPCGTLTDTTAGHWSTGGPLWVSTQTCTHSNTPLNIKGKKSMKEEVTKSSFFKSIYGGEVY